MGNLELLERAFNIAKSGEAETVDELREKLQEDGASLIDLDQFTGRALHRQLSEKIARSRLNEAQAKSRRGRHPSARPGGCRSAFAIRAVWPGYV